MGLYKQSNSPNYWMSFSVNGRQIKRSTGTTDKKLAEAIIGKVKAQVVEGKWFEVDQAKSHTFDDMMEKFMLEHAPKKKTRTGQRYKNSLVHLNKFFAGMTLADISTESISNYMLMRKTEPGKGGKGFTSVCTINREIAMLSKAFNLALKTWKWVRENPCQGVEKENEDKFRRERVLSPEEEERLLKACQGYLNNQLSDIVTLALNTAMRESNILTLKRSEIDLSLRVISIPKEKTKSGKPLSIPMNATVHNILSKKNKVANLSGYIFTTANNTPIRARNMFREYEKARAKVGLTDLWFHDLRHTAGTRLSKMGVDIRIIQQIMGHANISTTAKYIHHDVESLRTAINKLDNFAGVKYAENQG